MVQAVIDVIKVEEGVLQKLLILLEKQYSLIIKKDVFQLESLTEEIRLCNKEVAEVEVRRRKILGNRNMKEYVASLNSYELDMGYRSIKRKLEEINTQKETNELLIKQQLSYVNQMLNIINPRRETNVYNSYGKIKR